MTRLCFPVTIEKRYRSGYRAAIPVAKVARTAVSLAKRMFSGSSETKSSHDGVSDAITDQFNTRLIYKRRKAPRKIKRRAKKKAKYFLKKVLAPVAVYTNRFVHGFSASSLAAQQNMHAFVVAGMNDDAVLTTDGRNHMNLLLRNAFDTGTDRESFRLYITSLSFNYQLTNTSANIAELDIYQCVARKDFSSGTAYQNLTQVMTENFSELPTQGPTQGTNVQLSMTALGCSPFDQPQFGRYLIIKKVQRFCLGPSKSLSFNEKVHFRSPIMLSGEDLESAHRLSKKGLTRAIIIRFHGVPS